MDKDYYKILGITDDEKKLHGKEFKDLLNKKYKKLALELHPDRHVNDSEEERKAAEEKFKEVTEANTVLSDEEAREKYDNGGMNGMDFSEFMRSHFGGGFDPFGSFFGGGFGQQEQQAEFNINVHLTFDEAVKGGKKMVEIHEEPCSACHGTGMIRQTRRQGNMMFSSSAPCPHCHGTGMVHSNTTKKVEIHIPAGVDTGMAMRVQTNEGMARVSFTVDSDPYFVRPDSSNVIHYEKVPIKDCLLGFKKKFKTVDGGSVYVDAPECTPDGKAFMFNGMGMPNVERPGTHGDYAIVIQYIYPERLTSKQKEILKDF